MEHRTLDQNNTNRENRDHSYTVYTEVFGLDTQMVVVEPVLRFLGQCPRLGSVDWIIWWLLQKRVSMFGRKPISQEPVQYPSWTPVRVEIQSGSPLIAWAWDWEDSNQTVCKRFHTIPNLIYLACQLDSYTAFWKPRVGNSAWWNLDKRPGLCVCQFVFTFLQHPGNQIPKNPKKWVPIPMDHSSPLTLESEQARSNNFVHLCATKWRVPEKHDFQEGFRKLSCAPISDSIRPIGT